MTYIKQQTVFARVPTVTAYIIINRLLGTGIFTMVMSILKKSHFYVMLEISCLSKSLQLTGLHMSEQ